MCRLRSDHPAMMVILSEHRERGISSKIDAACKKIHPPELWARQNHLFRTNCKHRHAWQSCSFAARVYPVRSMRPDLLSSKCSSLLTRRYILFLRYAISPKPRIMNTCTK